MGYHPGLEDDGIYLSAVKAHLDPALYPRDADFFRIQTQATLFDEFIAGFVRLTHIPVEWAELLWQFLALYTILWASHRIAQRLFGERRAQWAGVALLASMFTLPVAGTAINLVDQHLHPRTIATALILLAIDRVTARRPGPAVLPLMIAMVMHPIMAVFGISFCLFLVAALTDSIYARMTVLLRFRGVAAAVPLGWILERPTPEWRRALNTRTYYFLYKWTWYEWLGAIGPLVLFWILWRWSERWERHPSGANALAVDEPVTARLKSCPDTKPAEAWFAPESESSCRDTRPAQAGVAPETETSRPFKTSSIRVGAQCGESLLARFAFALLLYGVFQQAVAMVLLAPAKLARITPLQPMRYLQLVYVFLVLIGGGLLGRYLLKRAVLRWTLFFVATCGGMFVSQRLMFPSSAHLELPWRAPSNSWLEAFAWIRQNTPVDAYFALDPSYLAAPGEDYHCFRALAERSQLADVIKDTAVVTQVPELASRWTSEVDAQEGWSSFGHEDFERLKARFGVDWVLLAYPAPDRLTCAWHNDRLSICRIPGPEDVPVP